MGTRDRELGDFAATRSVLRLAALALLIGAAVALLALALLDLIGLITHLAYTGTLSTALDPPDIHVLGVWSVLVPVARWADRGRDGTGRLRADSRSRDPRGDGNDPPARQPDGAAAGGAQADLERREHRHGRPVRRGGADHRDRRRAREHRRTAPASDRGGAANAARGRRGRVA